MKVKDTPTHTLIELLVYICEITDIKPATNMQLIAETMKEINGNYYFNAIKNAVKRMAAGYIQMKLPYRINNVFISDMMQKYIESTRQDPKEYKEEQIVKLSQEEINTIMYQGIEYTTQQYYDTFYNNNPRLIDAFFLEIKYDWMIEQDMLTSDQYADNLIEQEIRILKKYDTKNWKGTERTGFDALVHYKGDRKTDYRKAAIVALYMKEQISNNKEKYLGI